MHTHHSHSSDYCQHASSPLDEMIETAIARGFKVLCLTEHMPRLSENHLYPEEVANKTTITSLRDVFYAYYDRARKAQVEYRDRIQILVGFESETIDLKYLDFVAELREKFVFDLVVGSVHHVNGYPIDYSREQWDLAAATSSALAKSRAHVHESDSHASLIPMFEDYFDLQYAMLQSVKPQVVGHFDLIRLMAPEEQPESLEAWPTVWAKVVRNVKLAAELGCLFEVNSAAIRKGWSVPYPQPDVAQKIIELGGKFCLSDDSHCVAHVAQNYGKCLQYLEEFGVDSVYHLAPQFTEKPLPKVVTNKVAISELRAAGW